MLCTYTGKVAKGMTWVTLKRNVAQLWEKECHGDFKEECHPARGKGKVSSYTVQ